MKIFIFRHIIRTKLKSALVGIVAMFFMLALVFLHVSIIRVEERLDHMYDAAVVGAEIRVSGPIPGDRRRGDVIRPRTINEIFNIEFTQSELAVAIFPFTLIYPADRCCNKWDDCLEYWWNWDAAVLDEYGEVVPGTIIPIDEDLSNGLIGVNDLDLFVSSRVRTVSDHLTGAWILEYFDVGLGDIDWDAADRAELDDLQIEFKPGFYEPSFIYTTDDPIPVLISYQTMIQRGLSLGDLAYMCTYDSRTFSYIHRRAIVVGIHNRNNLPALAQDSVLMPLEAAENIFSRFGGHEIGFISVNFDIDPTWNRMLYTVREELQEILNHPDAGWTSLMLTLYDDELRNVVGSMEQTLSLLRLLYPVAIAVSIIIGAGLSLLLVLQNAKNTAIMRVLGSTKNRTRVVLWLEQLIVCLTGLIIGLAAAFILGWGVLASVMLAGLYLAGVVLGSVVGSVLVTSKPPLELLQVKE